MQVGAGGAESRPKAGQDRSSLYGATAEGRHWRRLSLTLARLIIWSAVAAAVCHVGHHRGGAEREYILAHCKVRRQAL